MQSFQYCKTRFSDGASMKNEVLDGIHEIVRNSSNSNEAMDMVVRFLFLKKIEEVERFLPEYEIYRRSTTQPVLFDTWMQMHVYKRDQPSNKSETNEQ